MILKNFFCGILILVGASALGNPTLSNNTFKLTCEYRLNPLGIDRQKPRLSWIFQSVERNQIQSAYELIVSDNLDAIKKLEGNVWRTGKIISPTNLHVEYAGEPLKSFTRYYWKVRIYDKNSEPSVWSEAAWFETSMLTASDWNAQWIGDGSKQFDRDEDFYQDDRMPLFRKHFETKRKISSARLYIAGLGYYEAYLNGKKIGDQSLTRDGQPTGKKYCT